MGWRWSSTMARTSATPSDGATTTTRDTAREAAMARTAWTSMGVPCSVRRAFGVPGPSRTPRPAAGITTAVRGAWVSSVIGSVQVCTLGRPGYGHQRAGRDVWTGPFRDFRSSRSPGTRHVQQRHAGGLPTADATPHRTRHATISIPVRQRAHRQACPSFVAPSRRSPLLRPDMPNRPVKKINGRYGRWTCALHATPLREERGVRRRAPRRGGPRPCPRWCSRPAPAR